MCTCSYSYNHNEQSTLLSVAVMYLYKSYRHRDIPISVEDNQIRFLRLYYTVTAVTPLKSTLRNHFLLTKLEVGTITSLVTERKNLIRSSSDLGGFLGSNGESFLSLNLLQHWFQLLCVQFKVGSEGL